ncbi:hypothetical protein [Salarchaeum sp. JOR-1]|uniref:DUF7504 family protein n=1 Tax=Salarchaeum sp. JOR-1 TaxID=2599399 RepID=UPI001198584D|nr:hypothetical protein [Salarchaeum sp. JOR-1]QDX40576.1 hypothetical protein FQU85_06550 [Salarchaeum sp. JOR-1]
MSQAHASGTDGHVFESVAGVSSVLVLGPADDRMTASGCRQLLAAPSEHAAHVVGVTYDAHAEFQERIADQGAPDATRTVLTTDGTDGSSVECVSVSDGARLLSAVRERVRDIDGESGVVCFDALTPLIADIGLTRTFQFLHRLMPELRERDVTAHFHADPEANDRQTLDAITTVFDAVVRADGDGWELVWKRHTE